MRNVRSDLIDLVDLGHLTTEQLARMALCYMSVGDLEDMIRANDLPSYVSGSGFRFTFEGGE